MPATMTNNSGLSLSMAVWLAYDEYDHGAGQGQHPEQDVISATALMKPTRPMILTARIPEVERQVDVADMISIVFGKAIHNSIEDAWRKGYRPAMTRLGYPKKMIDMILINPQDHELSEGAIPIYLEQRYFRSIHVRLPDGENDVIISGKFDQIINGELNDTKTTSVYSHISGSKDRDYQIQGSIYRWINPEKVTSDVIRIQHVFTDWQRSMARQNPDYPQSRILESVIPLMNETETEQWLRSKIREIDTFQDKPQEELPRCTPDELWMSPPVYKYYADPAKAAAGGRSTKNFPNYPAAALYQSKQGKGTIITVEPEAKACGYCSAASVCTQRLEYQSTTEEA